VPCSPRPSASTLKKSHRKDFVDVSLNRENKAHNTKPEVHVSVLENSQDKVQNTTRTKRESKSKSKSAPPPPPPPPPQHVTARTRPFLSALSIACSQRPDKCFCMHAHIRLQFPSLVTNPPLSLNPSAAPRAPLDVCIHKPGATPQGKRYVLTSSSSCPCQQM